MHEHEHELERHGLHHEDDGDEREKVTDDLDDENDDHDDEENEDEDKDEIHPSSHQAEDTDDDEQDDQDEEDDEPIQSHASETTHSEMSLRAKRNFIFYCLFALLIISFASQSHSSKTSYPVTTTSSSAYVAQTAPIFGVTPDGMRFQFPEVAQLAIQYENIYFRQNELDYSPSQLRSRANIWMDGEYSQTNTQGCFRDPVDGEALQVATWFYPCGTILRVVNEATGQWVYATVTDRGPNRGVNSLSHIPGYENDAVRENGFDVSPRVSRTIGHTSGGVLLFIPERIPNGVINTSVPALDLTASPPFNSGIDVVSGNFITNTEVAVMTIPGN